MSGPTKITLIIAGACFVTSIIVVTVVWVTEKHCVRKIPNQNLVNNSTMTENINMNETNVTFDNTSFNQSTPLKPPRGEKNQPNIEEVKPKIIEQNENGDNKENENIRPR